MLPQELSSIFQNKQKSYKMVLVLSLIEQYEQTQSFTFPLSLIAQRFLTYFQESSKQGKKVDVPPPGVASKWVEFTIPQTITLLKTPLEALSKILEIDQNQQVITFQPSIAAKLHEKVIQELKEYAMKELQNYKDSLGSSNFSLKLALEKIMNSYITAKSEGFAGHPIGTLFRKEIPEQLRALSFIDSNYKIQGSVGQGNWANIPWIAIMDKRITDTTQRGEYIVYLFSEDMESAYLTLNQGVTVPKKDYGKKEGHQFLENKAREIRKLLSLEGMQTDKGINLNSDSDLANDYQVSTIAYVRYDRNAIPDDETLLLDLENVVSDYKLYVEHILNNINDN